LEGLQALLAECPNSGQPSVLHLSTTALSLSGHAYTVQDETNWPELGT
jgi:hypothetical protein